MTTPWNSPSSGPWSRVEEDKPESDKASSQGTPPNTPNKDGEDTVMTEAQPEEDAPEGDPSEEDSSSEGPPTFIQFLYKTNRLRASVVAFSPDNRLLAIGHTVAGLISTKIELWELRDGAFTRTWEHSKSEDAVTALQFSPDG